MFVFLFGYIANPLSFENHYRQNLEDFVLHEMSSFVIPKSAA